MEKIVTGCSDCPFSYEFDMAVGYGCKARESMLSMDEYLKNKKVIKQVKYQPVTPDWCPLKSEPLTIKLEV